MNAIEKILNEMTDPFFDGYEDSERIWGKPSITLTYGDFRQAAAELAAKDARIAELEQGIKTMAIEVNHNSSMRDEYQDWDIFWATKNRLLP